MRREKYISIEKNVTGFSFANLGLFTGFGGGIIRSIYPLILLEILKSSALVGIYSSIYYAWSFFIIVFFGEVLRFFSKAKIFYSSLLMIFIFYMMFSFSIKPITFIVLDFVSEIPLIFVGMLIPLFMADFSNRGGFASLNSRYLLWLNVGGMIAPMFAIFLAGLYGNRSAFFSSGILYLFALLLFKRYKIVQEDKKIRKISPRRTLRSILRGVKSYFSIYKAKLGYFINFGYCSVAALQGLYAPIIITENGFSLSTLGIMLMLGTMPYVILSEPIGKIARKYGAKAVKIGLLIGFLITIISSIALFMSTGRVMLAMFLLAQIGKAIMSPLHDLLFFNSVPKEKQSRFFGIFATSASLPSFISPLIGVLFIFIFGDTFAIWLATAIIAIVTTLFLLFPEKSLTY